MKRELKLKKGETLHDWTVRIAMHYADTKVNGEELAEVLHELSVQSYIHGSRDAVDVLKKCKE
jgi:hypothetical protein